jgi:hypothetical protein
MGRMPGPVLRRCETDDSDLDDAWGERGGCDMNVVRELSDEDLLIVATLCKLSFTEITKLAAERLTEASEQ